MIFLIISIVVPIAIYFGWPPLIQALSKQPPSNKLPLAIGCFLFFISWYLPSPLIEGQNTQFTTHFIGGGVFTGFFWLYTKQQLKMQGNVLIELASLYALVSALGVANELFEWFIVQIGLINFKLTDTSWDLVANTAGAMSFWLLYRLCLLITSKTNRKLQH